MQKKKKFAAEMNGLAVLYVKKKNTMQSQTEQNVPFARFYVKTEKPKNVIVFRLLSPFNEYRNNKYLHTETKCLSQYFVRNKFKLQHKKNVQYKKKKFESIFRRKQIQTIAQKKRCSTK